MDSPIMHATREHAEMTKIIIRKDNQSLVEHLPGLHEDWHYSLAYLRDDNHAVEVSYGLIERDPRALVAPPELPRTGGVLTLLARRLYEPLDDVEAFRVLACTLDRPVAEIDSAPRS